jgi:hypothetical protein
MNTCTKVQFRFLAACVVSALLGAGGLAQAASGPPDFTIVFPAGTACGGFDLQVEGWLGKQHFREFSDDNGVVRTISAGTGRRCATPTCRAAGRFRASPTGRSRAPRTTSTVRRRSN